MMLNRSIINNSTNSHTGTRLYLGFGLFYAVMLVVMTTSITNVASGITDIFQFTS